MANAHDLGPHSGGNVPHKPRNVVDLDFAPAEREPFLNRGKWLILSTAIWSVPDQDAKQTAWDVAASYPAIKVGIRDFEHAEELKTWFPEHEGSRSPQWAFISEGEIVNQFDGVASYNELMEFVRTSMTTTATVTHVVEP